MRVNNLKHCTNPIHLCQKYGWEEFQIHVIIYFKHVLSFLSGLNADKKDLAALKKTLEQENRENVESKWVELFIVRF